MHGMHRSVSDPSLILGGQDSGGTWLSDDDGKTWKKNRDRFLYGFGIQGVLVDPTDPSRFYTAGQTLFQSANDNATLDGIYVSTDKGDTWTLKQVCPNMQHQRVGVNMAFDPNTSGAGPARSMSPSTTRTATARSGARPTAARAGRSARPSR